MGRMRRSATVAIIAVTLQACDTDRGPTTPPTSSTAAPPVVRGTILDFQTRTPVAGAVLRVGTDPVAGGTQTIADAEGRYSLPQPPHTGAPYYFTVNDLPAGRGYPVAAEYRGDLLIEKGTCVSRYGAVIDARTLRPLAGAVVTIYANTLATTAPDGWYRIDWGCPASGQFGFNTTFLTASHPSYNPQEHLVGRGIRSVQRLDFLLQPK